jgi:hypothetical protein
MKMPKLARISKVMSDKGHQEKLEAVVENAKTLGHQYFVAGFPVEQELMEFTQGIQKVMPKVKFYPNTLFIKNVAVNDENGVYQTTRSMRVCDELFVYMDEFPFDIGRVGYADNSVTNKAKAENTYSVYSRKISNAKYALHRDQHHMIMTKDMGKAIKNACKYLVPYTTRELAQAFYEPIHNNVSNVFEEVKSKMHNGAREIVNNRMAILQEVAFLKKQGVEFTTPEFRDLAGRVDQLIADYAEQEKRQISAFFVRFRQVGDSTYADLQEVLEVRNIRWDAKMNTTGTQALTYPVNELPQDIAGQIAVLNILENDGYVAGVGMKLDDTNFWVERG